MPKPPRKPTEPVKSDLLYTELAANRAWLPAGDGKQLHLAHWSWGSDTSPCGLKLGPGELPTLEEMERANPGAFRLLPLCERCIEGAVAGDFIVKTRWSTTPNRRYTFPTLCSCSGCGGMRAIYFRGQTVERPDLAFHVSLIQHGTVMHAWDNSPPSHACDCATRRLELRDLVAELKILSDTGWSHNDGTSNVSRGINDFDRTIKYDRPLAEDMLAIVREWLQRDDCPGWTGIVARELGPGEYRFSTTWDSSD